MIAKISSSVNIITDYPFSCTFDLAVGQDFIKAALVGHRGERVSEALRVGDYVTVDGHWIAEKTFGKLFIIENMTLPAEVKIGRSLNLYA